MSATPVILSIVAFKGSRALRVFVLWSIMAISTVAIFDWHLRLLDLVPESTASRFMYYALPGLAILIGWTVQQIGNRIKSIRWKSALAILAAIGFLAINHAIIRKVSQEYFKSQDISKKVIASFADLKSKIGNVGPITVVLDSIPSNPSVNQSPRHLEAIANIKYGVDWNFTTALVDSITQSSNSSSNKVYWKLDPAIERFREYSPTL
jgi:hypothetical protein